MAPLWFVMASSFVIFWIRYLAIVMCKWKTILFLYLLALFSLVDASSQYPLRTKSETSWKRKIINLWYFIIGEPYGEKCHSVSAVPAVYHFTLSIWLWCSRFHHNLLEWVTWETRATRSSDRVPRGPLKVQLLSSIEIFWPQPKIPDVHGYSNVSKNTANEVMGLLNWLQDLPDDFTHVSRGIQENG